jgi:hypothetical protein
MRAHARSVISHKEQTVNTNATQGPTEETPAAVAQPTAAADTQKPAAPRRRGYENGIDVTAQGSQPIISLPVYGKFNQRPISVDDLDRAWFSLFNERENGAKLIDDLRGLIVPPSELDIRMYEVKRREEIDAMATPLYLIVASDQKDRNVVDAVPVVQYLVSTDVVEGLFKTPSPVKARSIFKFSPGEDVLAKYKFAEENAPAQGPTEETPAPGKDSVALEGGILDRWLKADHFMRALPAYFWFSDDQLAQIRGVIWNARLASAKVLMTEVEEPGVFLVRVAASSNLNAPVLELTLYSEIDEGGEKRRITNIVSTASAFAGAQAIEVPKFWLHLGDLAHRWKSIFNEDEFGQVVVSRLGDLEKRQGTLSMRILNPEARQYVIQVFRVMDLPSMIWAGNQAITKNGTLMAPIDTIRLFTTIVEGIEVVARMQVDDEFAAPDHAPKQSAEDVVAQSRRATLIDLHPTDIRTFDAITFQQFVDQVRQANLSTGDAARLVAFMEFIAKCQQIEQQKDALFFHCTAHGRKLDMLLGAGKRHFPGATAPMPGSILAPTSRWGALGDWGPKAMGQSQQSAAPQTYVQPNQTVSDVVISVFSATGTLLGVFQCAVPPAGYTLG